MEQSKCSGIGVQPWKLGQTMSIVSLFHQDTNFYPQLTSRLPQDPAFLLMIELVVRLAGE